MLKRGVHIAVIGLNLAVLFFLGAAGYHSFHKPGLPASDAANLPLRIDSVDVPAADDAELFLSRYAIGDSVTLSYADPSGQRVARGARLAPYESTPLTVLKIFLVAAIFTLGFVVYFFRPPSTESALFNVASISLSAAIMGAKTISAVPPAWLGGALCVMFFLCYGALAAAFFHFTMYFPRIAARPALRMMPAAYAASSGVSVWAAIAYLHDARGHAAARYAESALPSSLLNALVVALLALGVGNFIHSYATAADPSEKKRLRWILFGLCVGPAPFLLFSALPQALGLPPVVPEPVMLSFLLILPASFAVAIVRHRVLNIDLIINRSIVYAASLGGLVVGAALLFGAVAAMVDAYAHVTSPLLFIVIAVSFAMLFQPLKSRVQGFVDRRFFHLRYDFRETQRRLFEAIRRSYDVRGLARLVTAEVQKILPVDRIGFFLHDHAGRRLRIVAHEEFAILESRGVPFGVEGLTSPLGRPIALEDAVEPGLDTEPADAAVFGRWGMALAVGCTAEDGSLLGFLVLGRKKSGFRFLAEDIDLLAGIAAQTGQALERITMQERLILEHAETERLEKLNRLKSYFVSSVTHDLKTPLTSIKMFAELLRTDANLPAKDREEFLAIIEGETDRLTRMINTVLDFSMVEKGIKTYRPVATELNREVEAVLRSLQYPLTIERFTLERRLSPEPCLVHLDRDAFAEALWNLVSNAMKYSAEEKRVVVSTFVRGAVAAVRVEDRGAGIPPDQLGRIFDQFYRCDDGRHREVGGTGLGLAIVKHIMEGHGGTIDVESAVGEGSAFTLLFPLKEGDETNSGG